MSKIRSTLTGALAAAVGLSLVVTAPADARRGGSFGSRGYRTYSAPRPTPTAPGYTAPVQRSMTPPSSNPGASPYGYQPARPSNVPGQPNGGGFLGGRPGFGTGLAAGLLTGGLVGALMGHGFGGGWGGAGMGAGGGFLATLLQLLVLGALIALAVRFFRRRSTPAMAGPFGAAYDSGPQPAQGPWGAFAGGQPGGMNNGGGFGPGGQAYPSPADEIAVSAADRAAFERLLSEVQDAFGREDYAALRERTTPEVMSYLAEELSQNATHNRRNDVSQTRLLQSDVSEAWSEGDTDYATAAMRYESVDVMRDRQTGAVVEGDPDRPTTTTELWTFVRRPGEPWKLSAIQET
jgi:predicted lipid-binding transport protein (Tim44 family)